MARLLTPLVVVMIGVIAIGAPAAANTGPASSATATERGARVHRLAVVVGVNQSLDDEVRPLSFADDDAVRFFQLLEPTTDEVVLLSLLDADTQKRYPALSARAELPTFANLSATLARLHQRVAALKATGARVEFTFVYCGHGSVNEAHQGYVSLMDRRWFRADLFEQLVKPSQADYLHLVIDACKSYYLVHRRGLDHTAAIRQLLDQEDLERYPRVGVVLSTSGDEESHEWSRLGAGIASYEVQSAMRGLADVNGDGLVEYGELHAFVHAANVGIDNEKARPRFFVRAPGRDLRRAFYQLPSYQLTGPSPFRVVLLSRDASLRGFCEDERGERLADFNKEPGWTQALWIPRARRHYVVIDTEEYEIDADDGGVVLLADLEAQPRRHRSRASVEQSFRRQLFAYPFGRKFYNGFASSEGLALFDGDEPVLWRPYTSRSALDGLELGVGYTASTPPFALEGIRHGPQLGVRYRLHRVFGLALRGGYALSGHEPQGNAFTVHYASLAAGPSVAWAPTRWSRLTADLLGGAHAFWQVRDQESVNQESVNKHQNIFFALRGGAQLRLLEGLYAEVGAGVELPYVALVDHQGVELLPLVSLGLSYLVKR